MQNEYTKNVVYIISKIPKGKVLTYKSVAALAGNPKGARQVSWILHSLSGKYHLPWHRVINSKGKISLKSPSDYKYQKHLLESEEIVFSANDEVNLNNYLWSINSIKDIE